MPKRPIKAEDLLRIVFVGDPQISPDGSRILFLRKTISDKNKYVTNLCTVDMEGNVRQWTGGDSGAGHGRWSPDGSQIAFISSREEKKGQIFLIPVDGGQKKSDQPLPFNIRGLSVTSYEMGTENQIEAARKNICELIQNGMDKQNTDSIVHDALDDEVKVERKPKPIDKKKIYTYDLLNAPGKQVGIITGDIQQYKRS